MIVSPGCDGPECRQCMAHLFLIPAHQPVFPETCFVKMSFFLLGGEQKVR